jgi:hypothetical protein
MSPPQYPKTQKAKGSYDSFCFLSILLILIQVNLVPTAATGSPELRLKYLLVARFGS